MLVLLGLSWCCAEETTAAVAASSCPMAKHVACLYTVVSVMLAPVQVTGKLEL